LIDFDDYLNDDLKILGNKIPVGLKKPIFRFIKFDLKESYSLTYSKISPGWQSRILQIASRVSNRIPFAFPVFRIDKLAGVISNFSANSLLCILRLASITSTFTIIGIAI